MVDVCDICGDVGVVDAIITCSQCKLSCEHLYCMRIYCGVLGNLPKDWKCDECEMRNAVITSSNAGLREDLPEASAGTVYANASTSTAVTFYIDAICSSGPNKLDEGKGWRQIKWEKKVKKGKVKYLTAQEAVKLSSGSRKSESSLKSTLQPGSSKTTPLISIKTPIKPKEIPKFCLWKDLGNQSGHLKSPRPDEQISPMQQMKQIPNEHKGKSVQLPIENHVSKAQPMGTSEPAQVSKTATTTFVTADNAYLSPMHCPSNSVPGNNVCDNAKLRKPGAENRKLMDVVDEVENLYTSDPALEASWEGSFKVIDSLHHVRLDDTGFLAYPPSRVLRKVYETLKKMPKVLDFELLPRQKLWVEMFPDSVPDRDDIGVYFFPCKDGRSDSYVSLLEYMCMKDIIMRKHMEGVELLVLTSRLLHVNYQKWNGKYFLWGVFRRVKKVGILCKKCGELATSANPLARTNDSHIEGSNSGEVDMEIDMEGGQNVGRVDAAISRATFWSGCGNTKHHASSDGKEQMSDDIPPSPGIEQVNGLKVQDKSGIGINSQNIPALSRNMYITQNYASSDEKEQTFDDVRPPPGVERVSGLKIRSDSCAVSNENPLVKNAYQRTESKPETGSLLSRESIKDTVLQKYSEKNNQLAKGFATVSLSCGIKDIGIAVEAERHGDERYSKRIRDGCMATPIAVPGHLQTPKSAKLLVPPKENCGPIQHPSKVKQKYGLDAMLVDRTAH